MLVLVLVLVRAVVVAALLRLVARLVAVMLNLLNCIAQTRHELALEIATYPPDLQNPNLTPNHEMRRKRATRTKSTGRKAMPSLMNLMMHSREQVLV